MSSLYLYKQENPTFIDVNHWCNLKTKSKVIAGCVIDELQFGISRLLIFLGMNFTICECVPPRTLAQSIYLTTFTKIFGRVKYFMLIPRWVWLSLVCLIVWLLRAESAEQMEILSLSQRAACLIRAARECAAYYKE